MLKKFRLEDSKPTKTPMSTKIKITKDDEADSMDSSKYGGRVRHHCICLFDLAAFHLVGLLRTISEVELQALADLKSILYGLRFESFGIEFCVELKIYVRGVQLILASMRSMASKLGCLVHKTPFPLSLGNKVGGKYVKEASLERSGGQVGFFNARIRIGNKASWVKVEHVLDSRREVSGGVETCWTSIVHTKYGCYKGRGINGSDIHPIEAGEWGEHAVLVDKWNERRVSFKSCIPNRMFALELNNNATVSSKLIVKLDNSIRRKAREDGIEEMQLNSFRLRFLETTLLPCEDHYVGR
ncbi:hypothetical protein Tco_0542076 [Tanacetum coccineum]